MAQKNISIVLPAKNEAESLGALLPSLRATLPAAEIIVVSDGSTDNTADVCAANGVKCIRHPYSMGNGAAIKTGARAANGDVIVFMDADGQHHATEIARLLEPMESGSHMAVGARHTQAQSTIVRGIGNRLYNRIASWIVGHPIADLTSGFRAVVRRDFMRFLHLLPNGFSYPTTITMAFFREGLPITYVPVNVSPNRGHSHISVIKDGLRFFLIILRVGTLYSPLKFFVPISGFFFLIGISYYLYTYVTAGQFTNMSALLLITAVLTFFIGIVSEQITNLLYSSVSAEPGANSRNGQ